MLHVAERELKGSLLRGSADNTYCCPARQVINHQLPNGAPEMWEQVVDFDTKKVRRRGHYVVDRKQQQVSLTAEGMHRALARLGARARLIRLLLCPPATAYHLVGSTCAWVRARLIRLLLALPATALDTPLELICAGLFPHRAGLVAQAP